MPLPQAVFSTPPEGLEPSWGERECDLSEKPGVRLFRDFVLGHEGGWDGGIVRPCPSGDAPASGHYSGRAWDWMISALEPGEKARADEVIDWLLANDAEMFRRVGLTYLIWDKRKWGGLRARWEPYDGFDVHGQCTRDVCRNPHVSHVHFSFSKAGAAAETSFYDWLQGGEPSQVPIKAAAESPVWPAVVGFGIGAGGMIAAARYLRG